MYLLFLVYMKTYYVTDSMESSRRGFAIYTAFQSINSYIVKSAWNSFLRPTWTQLPPFFLRLLGLRWNAFGSRSHLSDGFLIRHTILRLMLKRSMREFNGRNHLWHYMRLYLGFCWSDTANADILVSTRGCRAKVRKLALLNIRVKCCPFGADDLLSSS